MELFAGARRLVNRILDTFMRSKWILGRVQGRDGLRGEIGAGERKRLYMAGW